MASRQYLDQLRNPQKTRARSALASAIKRGDICPPIRCEKCGVVSEVQAHHRDYSQPLDVTWLCRPCHTAAHSGPRGAQRPKFDGKALRLRRTALALTQEQLAAELQVSRITVNLWERGRAAMTHATMIEAVLLKLEGRAGAHPSRMGHSAGFRLTNEQHEWLEINIPKKDRSRWFRAAVNVHIQKHLDETQRESRARKRGNGRSK